MSEDVTPYMAQVAERPTVEELRELIAQSGLSQRKAAEALDLGERQMRYYASGQQPIPLVVIYALRYLVGREHASANRLVDITTEPDWRRTRPVGSTPAWSAQSVAQGYGRDLPEPEPTSARGVAERNKRRN
jgi:hypothetical protein